MALYLPDYDTKGLERVIAKLSKPDDGLAPVDVEKSEDLVELRRAKGGETAFGALAEVPSYIVPRQRKTSQVRRLMKFARLLTNDEIDDDAVTTAKATLLKVLNTEYKRLKKSAWFKAASRIAGRLRSRL